MQFSICVAEQQVTFSVLTSMFQQALLLLLHINNHHASPYCIGILMPPVNGSMWHKSSSVTASTWKHVDAWTSFHRAKLCLQNKREKSMTVYVNQGMFLYFLCPPLSPPPPPGAILHLSLAGAGRSARWPALQSLDFAFNQSLMERERVWVPDASCGSPAECQEMDLNNWHAGKQTARQTDRQTDTFLTSVKHNSDFNTMIDM